MKNTKRVLAALLAALCVPALGSCGKDGADLPAATGFSDDFQKNLHQSEELSFLETDAGYYFTYGSLYYLDKDSGRATVVCGKPDCDHSEDSGCNARIGCDYMLTGGDAIYYVGCENEPKEVLSVSTDGAKRRHVQELKFHENTAAQSSWDQGIYHRGYVYYMDDDTVFRVPLGGEKDAAVALWAPENPETAQKTEDGGLVFNPNWIHYTLWADGDLLYFMANVQVEDGSYRDALFRCDLEDLSVRRVWVTPDPEEVGSWERAGVSVSQWYVTGDAIYFYLSGGDMWRGDLNTGKNKKIADTHGETVYGSAVFSDDYMCLLNDAPRRSPTDPEIDTAGALRHYGGDTVYVYGLDGELLHELSLQPLHDELGATLSFDLLFCDESHVYFLTTQWGTPSESSGSGDGVSFSVTTNNRGGVYLCRASPEGGEVQTLYQLR